MDRRSHWDDQESYQAFVIVSSARAGSTYLESLLSSHPDILSFREIFGVRKFYPGYRGLVYLNTLFHKQNVRHLLRVLFHKNFTLMRALIFSLPAKSFFSDLLFGSYPSAIKGVGFKYHIYHGAGLPELKEYLRQHKEIKIIHLIRRNSLDMLVSQKLARASGQWVLKDKMTNRARHMTIFLKKEECEKAFRLYDNQKREAEILFAHHGIHVLYYKDLVENQEAALDKVLEFLGLEKRRLSSPLRKQETRELGEIIANYESLKLSFEGTRWAGLFYE